MGEAWTWRGRALMAVCALALAVAVIGAAAPVGAEQPPCPVLSTLECPDDEVAPPEPAPAPTTTTTTTAPPPPPSPAAAAGRLLERMNAERARRGLPLLRARADVAGIAGRWSASMAERRALAHNDAYFTAATRRRLDAAALGENVAFAASVDQAHDRLMASSGHRANILNPRFTVVGVGAVHRDGQWWLTEDFLEPRASAPSAPRRSTTEVRTVAATTRPAPVVAASPAPEVHVAPTLPVHEPAPALHELAMPVPTASELAPALPRRGASARVFTLAGALLVLAWVGLGLLLPRRGD